MAPDCSKGAAERWLEHSCRGCSPQARRNRAGLRPRHLRHDAPRERDRIGSRKNPRHASPPQGSETKKMLAAHRGGIEQCVPSHPSLL